MNTEHRQTKMREYRGDGMMHSHYEQGWQSCALGCGCIRYRPDIPELVAIRILLGPEVTNDEAATILMGPK